MQGELFGQQVSYDVIPPVFCISLHPVPWNTFFPRCSLEKLPISSDQRMTVMTFYLWNTVERALRKLPASRTEITTFLSYSLPPLPLLASPPFAPPTNPPATKPFSPLPHPALLPIPHPTPTRPIPVRFVFLAHKPSSAIVWAGCRAGPGPEMMTTNRMIGCHKQLYNNIPIIAILHVCVCVSQICGSRRIAIFHAICGSASYASVEKRREATCEAS